MLLAGDKSNGRAKPEWQSHDANLSFIIKDLRDGGNSKVRDINRRGEAAGCNFYN